MGLYLQKNNNRSQLQQRLDEELRAKAKTRAARPEPDGVDDSAYLKGTTATSRLAGLWVLGFVIMILAIIVLLLVGN